MADRLTGEGRPSVPEVIRANIQIEMHSSLKISDYFGIWRTALLTLRVHCYGFRRNPAEYLRGIWWRLVGKKLRSRQRLATLIAQSPHAYRLWMARHEPLLIQRLPQSMPADAPSILVVIDPGTQDAELAETIASVRASDPNARIALSTNEIKANGWVLPLRAGDRISAHALPAYAEAAMRYPNAPAIYADDDLISNLNNRYEPHFKPDWNPALFLNHDFISHAALLRSSGLIVTRPNWLRQLIFEALSEDGALPIHLPHVLHHRRERPAPCPPVDIEPVRTPAPHVTILIPTRDQLELLEACLDGLARTDYPNWDCIVIDNDSRTPDAQAYLASLDRNRFAVVRYPGEFNFSAMNNTAASLARGELICFLNNDIEIVDSGWLRAMVNEATRPKCGAVGAKLLYPDGTIQHAGVVTGVCGGAAHAHRNLPNGDPGYFRRVDLPQHVSAVTAACMVVAKSKFEAVGGFDESNFAVAFNDVDLCLKLNGRGWQCFYEPRAVLIHHESKSRGSDTAPQNRERFARELASLKRIWGTDKYRDPFHHPQLSPFCEAFLLAI